MRAAEHFLADVGHRAATPRRRAGQALHGTGGEAGLIADHDRHDGAARPLLFIGDEIADRGHRHDRDLAPQAFGKPFLRGARLQPRDELALDQVDMLQAVDAHEQSRVVAQLEQSQHLAEGAPLRRRHRGDAEPALLGLVDADRECRPEAIDADPPHDVAAHESFEHDVFGDRDAGLEDAERTAAAAPVLHAAQHRGCRRDKTPEAGEDAGLEIRRMHRRALGRPDQFDQPGQRADRRVRRFKLRIRTRAAEPAHVEMNEAGITLLDACEIEGRAIRHIDVAAVEQNVACADQFGQADRCAVVACVQRDARLVEIEKRKPGAVPFRRQRRGLSQRIAGRRLDFLYARTKIGEQAGAIARRGRAPDLDNPQMRQRAHQASPWPDDRRGASAGSVSCFRP